MAERRMFSKKIIDSDAFLDMPLSSQTLYFHLSMRADDEGFINNPKKIQRMIGASDDDMKMLLAKNFIISFESGVIVIKHWKIHNYIRGDRLSHTAYQDEKSLLEIKENGAYTLCDELKEIEKLDAKDLRKLAYKESSLPYSFSYKIKRAFEGKICPVCGVEMSSSYKLTEPTIQHNTPISKGGKHELDNISVICESCNTSIRNIETDKLNNADVIETWDKIVDAEKKKIKWFWDVSLLDSQMSVKCQSNVSIGKDSIGKDSIGKSNIYSARFEEFWSAYKKKRDKKRAYDCYNARLKDGFSEEELITACHNYMNECEKEDREERYIKDAKTFLSVNTPFVDYLPKEPVKTEPDHKIFDEQEQYIAPYFGFPKEWFDGKTLIHERVKPIVRPIVYEYGWYEEKTLQPSELIEDYEARRAWYEQNNNAS